MKVDVRWTESGRAIVTWSRDGVNGAHEVSLDELIRVYEQFVKEQEHEV